MASLSEGDLSCPVCCDIFVNPVLLSCSHSFCSSCIQRVWGNKTVKECPVCRTTSSNERPPINLALKNMCESFQQQRRQKSGSGVCRDHKEELKLFCLDDQQPVCVVCRDSRKHTNHRFSPVNEAVADNKEILKASLERLHEELRTSVNREQNLCKTAEDTKFHAQCIETQIKEEFEQLHQLLHDEEAVRITALREEEEKRSQRIKKKIEKTSKQISSLTNTIRDIEEQMKAEDVSFLQNFEATLQRAQYIPDPNLSPSVTITFTDHLTNLKLNVVQKMQDNVGKSGEDSRKMKRRGYERWKAIPVRARVSDSSDDEYNLGQGFSTFYKLGPPKAGSLQWPHCSPPPSRRPLPPDSRPLPPDSRPLPPDSRPLPPDSRPLPPDSRPLPPDSRPLPPDRRPLPPDRRPLPPDRRPLPPDLRPLPPKRHPLPATPFTPSSLPGTTPTTPR